MNRPTYLRLKELLSQYFGSRGLRHKIYLLNVLDDKPKTRRDVYDEYHREVGWANMNDGLTLNQVDSLLRMLESTPLVEAELLPSRSEYTYIVQGKPKHCTRCYMINGYRRTES